jgi:hypothetical protein
MLTVLLCCEQVLLNIAGTCDQKRLDSTQHSAVCKTISTLPSATL